MSTHTPIASVTLSSAQPSVTFSGIPQTYTDLVLVINATSSSGADIWIRCNGDSGSNYSYTALWGDGTSAASGRGSTLSQGLLTDYYGAPSSTPNICIVQFNNYSNSTTFKTTLSRANRGNSGTDLVVSMWRSTSAITSLTLRFGGSQTFSTGSTFNLYGIANASITNTAKATGGDSVYTDGTYWYHIFGSSGIFTSTENLTADYLVVAGGGGGGGNIGGGGGAGGLKTSTGYSVTSGTGYTVTIGAGGYGGGNTQSGGDGSNSVFDTITSTGGGGGGNNYNGSPVNGRSGGSGGGGGGGNSGTNTGGSASPSGQGNAGGNGFCVPTNNQAGGGGGGAGGVGSNAANSAAGLGGAGSSSSISGASLFYAAGGGGGGGNSNANGGSSIGGNGGQGVGAIFATNGTANRGAGGGGGGNGTQVTGGSGGSGIVIIRYAV